ncbi:MAG TPA: NAD(P)-dependent oxidoreductase [Candidatus Binataceae bacterium]|nr:NAD(P)-dependent oxidoreductase [Stellaceae bacterium]HVC45089.1 NAD(P)-dependent oxidoreductase [Candidatus Binataceae bacterium]
MRIGFIGLGNMGGPMSLNLIKAGHSLVVNDVRREMAEPQIAGGAQWADTAAAVAAKSELVFTSLPGPKEVEAVALGENGILSGITKGAVYADLSTNSPSVIRRIHAAFKAKGFAMLDAPVSGGIPGARSATLSVMVGGDQAVYEKIKPALDAIGDKVSFIGDSGAGAVAKLVHNMVAICSTQLLVEAFTMGMKAGVPADALLKAVQDGAYGQGMILKGALPKMVMRGNFDRVTFALKLARKDLALATEVGREVNVAMPIATTVEQDFLTALAHGLGDKDMTAVVTVQEDRAGIKVRN